MKNKKTKIFWGKIKSYQALGSHFYVVFMGKHEINYIKLNPVKRSVHVIGQLKIYERYGPITTAHEPKLLKGFSLGFIR